MNQRRRQWGKGLAWVLSIYVITVIMLIASLEIGDSDTRWWVVLPVTLVAVALFGSALARVRGHLAAAESQQVRLRGAILVVTTLVVLVGVVMFVTAVGGRNVRFVSLTIVVVGVSHLLSEYRNVRTRRRGRAVALAAICLSLSTGGVYWQSSNAGTALLVAIVGAGFGYLAMVTASEQMWLAWRRKATENGEGDRSDAGGAAVGLSSNPLAKLKDRSLWAALGAAALFLGLAMYRSMGAGSWGIGVVLVLGPLLYTAIRRGDVDLVLIVLIFGLWWAVSPASETPSESLLPEVVDDTSARTPVLLVFGDSFASGEGAQSYFAGTNERGRNECRRASTAYHHLLAQASGAAAHPGEDGEDGKVVLPAWRPMDVQTNDVTERLTALPQRVLSVACSGAVAANITTIAQFEEQPALPGGSTPPHDLTQLQLADVYLKDTASQVDTIMISIGGNDALFSTVVTTCLAPGDCSEVGQYFVDALSRLEGVEAAYNAINEHPWNEGLDAEAPRIMVIPYPQPLAGTSCIRLLSDAEHRFVNDFVRRLNTRLAQLAAEAGFEFVSPVETALAETDKNDERLCGGTAWQTAQNDQGLNFFDAFPVQGSLTSRVNPVSWVHNSFHPNATGHELLAKAILRHVHDPTAEDVPKSSLDQTCATPPSRDEQRFVEKMERVWDLFRPPAEFVPAVEKGIQAGAALSECFVGETCRDVEIEDSEDGDGEGDQDSEDGGGEGDPDSEDLLPRTEVVCEHPCDETLRERGDPAAARDDCPGTWAMGEFRSLAGATYWPNLFLIIGLWMLTTAVTGRSKHKDDPEPEEEAKPEEDPPPEDGPDAEEDPVVVDVDQSVDVHRASGTVVHSAVADAPGDAAGDVIIIVWTLVALGISLALGSAWRMVPFGFAALLTVMMFFDLLERRAPRGGFVDTEEPLRARSGERSDPFAGEMRSWDRILREFRYQILGWLGAATFVVVVFFRAGEGALLGLAAGIAFAVGLGSALFPMVVSRPRQRSSQIALLSVVVFFAFVSGFLWPWTVARANEADAGTIGRDLPLLAGGVLAIALLVASAIVDGAVREKQDEADSQGTFGQGIQQWLRTVPDKGASQLHSAQSITATGLLIAAIAAKQMDGAEAYTSFALIVAVIIVNWWAIFLQEAGRLWPIATTVVLTGTVAVEILLSGGLLLLGRGAMALLALFTIARVFSARTLRAATLLIAIAGVLAVYQTGASTGTGEGEQPPANFADAMRRGADEIWKTIFGSFGVDDPPSPGLVAFAVVAIGLVLVYRAMETTNGRRTLTPVTVEKFTAPSSFKDVDALTSQLQSELARAGIVDPPFVPSAGLSSDVISVFEGSVGASWASAAKALANLARPDRGSVVIPTLEAFDDTQATVTVRVTDARTGGIRYTATFHGATPREAVRKAVAFVAQSTLGSSVTTPAWARWESDDGLPLRFYLESRSSSHYGDAISLDERIRKLRVAIAASPSTGLTRVDLGHVHELRLQPWRALRIHLEAAEQHRRLVPAHYRAATGLSMIAGQLLAGQTRPEKVSMNDRIMIAENLAKVLRVHTKQDFGYFSRDDLLCTASSPALRHRLACAFLEAADDLISGVLRITSTPVLILNAIVHQAERSHWLELLSDIDARRRETGRYLVLRELVRVRLMTARAVDLGPRPWARLDAELSDQASRDIGRWHELIDTARTDAERIVRDYDGAGTRYNYACLLAILATTYEEHPRVFEHGYGEHGGHPERDRVSDIESWRGEAVSQLYASRSHPGGGFPSADWVRIDPDLVALHGHQLFAQLLEWLDNGEAEIAAARRVGADEVEEVTETMEGRGQWDPRR